MKDKQTKKQKESLNDSNNNNKLTIEEPIKHNFIILYDTIYKNNDLTSDEIHLLIKLVSSAPTFKPTLKSLESILKFNHRLMMKTIKGLKEKGYLTIVKNGKKSEWHVTQEPTINKVKKLDKESLSNALVNFEITPKELKQLHRLKIIDDLIYTETLKLYTEKLQKIIKTKWLDD